MKIVRDGENPICSSTNSLINKLINSRFMVYFQADIDYLYKLTVDRKSFTSHPLACLHSKWKLWVLPSMSSINDKTKLIKINHALNWIQFILKTSWK